MPIPELQITTGRSATKIIYGNTFWIRIQSYLGEHFLLLPSGNICITIEKKSERISISQRSKDKWTLITRPSTKVSAFAFVEIHLPLAQIYSKTQVLVFKSQTPDVHQATEATDASAAA